MKRNKTSALAITLALAGLAPLYAQQVVVAVAPFIALDGNSQANARTIAEIFGIELQATGMVRVVTRANVEAIMKEHQFQLNDLSNDKKTAELGKALNANWVVRGQVQNLDERIVVTATLLDVKTLEIMAGAPMYLSRAAEIESKMDAFMTKLKERIAGGAAGNASPQAAAIAAHMATLPGGTFTMGSPANEPSRSDDETQHRVTVSRFSIHKYAVTQEEYEAVMGTNPSRFKGGRLPVENVSWYDAVTFCNTLSGMAGLTPAYTVSGSGDAQTVTWNTKANGYRLPTEAEWEYACRAGTTTPFNTGNNITTAQANYNGNYPYNGNAKGVYRQTTTAAGSFAANAWGLYDMHGNVYEWCWDWYGEYAAGPQTDPRGPPSGSDRVHRGGSWHGGAQSLRSAFRGDFASYWNYNLGFRLARSL